MDHFVYLNDFHKYVTSQTLITGLDEAEYHRLNFIFSNQHTAQLHSRVHFDKVIKSLFNSIGTICAFRAGAPDAEILLREFSCKKFDAVDDYTDLAVNEFMVKMQQGADVSEPFQAYVVPPKTPRSNRYQQGIIDRCREQYCRPRGVVEHELQTFANKWLLRKNTEKGKGGKRNKNQSQEPKGKKAMPPDAHRFANAEAKYRRTQEVAPP